jgi:hypothetical protein
MKEKTLFGDCVHCKQYSFHIDWKIDPKANRSYPDIHDYCFRNSKKCDCDPDKCPKERVKPAQEDKNFLMDFFGF